MVRKKINTNNTIYRFMCVRSEKNTNYHTDFNCKEDAMKYLSELKDKKIIWYGVYEIDEVRDTLKCLISKRFTNEK